MFSGLIEATGTISQLTALGTAEQQQGQRLALHAPSLNQNDIKIGDSIALNGVCLTVIEQSNDTLLFDVSSETLRCSAGFSTGQTVNLEKALQVGDRLGGHIVLGHVDGIGHILRYQHTSDSWDLVIAVPSSLAPFVATKGSITLNGVSLTTNRVEDTPAGCQVHLTLIPHTQHVTAFSHAHEGDSINIEIDMMARYACRYLSLTHSNGTLLDSHDVALNTRASRL